MTATGSEPMYTDRKLPAELDESEVRRLSTAVSLLRMADEILDGLGAEFPSYCLSLTMTAVLDEMLERSLRTPIAPDLVSTHPLPRAEPN
ncbi:hypothetical protein [Chthonobacter albigriseus]|uniref:hypothetical protein n=1 Tax=Chthonobacter albigriseus TaxID=1683161 RepID=UPI0015EF8D47|nr:hypothetical protein [Chthonobacter albigriseus]